MQNIKKSIFSLKLLNRAGWLLVLLTYISKVGYTEAGYRIYGFPYKFWIIYDGNMGGETLMMSSSLNVLGLLNNLLIIYVVVVIFDLLLKFINKKRNKKNNNELAVNED